jgi:hypothetical protein
MNTSKPSRRRRFIRPNALFFGVACGFLACCLAGRLVAGHNHYPNFTRFHSFINPESLHYPTASECLAVAEDGLAPDQVAVVVGGNSVLFGFGQSADEVWTVALQRRLGDRFRVFNFGLNGSYPSEFGAAVAEALGRRHRRVLCVTDVWAGTASSAGPPGRGKQPYFFWDAYYKGLLEDYSERKPYLAEAAVVRDEAYDESRRRGWLDSLTYADDLWTAVSCRGLSTSWCPAVAERFWAPRCSFADPGAAAPLGRYSDPDYIKRLEGIIPIANKSLAALHWPDAPPDTPDADFSGSLLVRSFKLSFPPSRRAETLVLVNHMNPYIWRRLDPAVRERYAPEYAATVHALRQAGFAATEVHRDYEELDFADYDHLASTGAVKLAGEVAPHLQKMARDAGWID